MEQQIFPTRIISGQCQNFDICNEISLLAEQYKSGDVSTLLVSEKWNEQQRTADAKMKDAFGVTSFGTEDRLFDIEEWTRAADFILDMARALLGSDVATLTTMWVSVYPEGGYIPEHIHSDAVLSGVFYAKALEGAGDLVFHDPAWVAKTSIRQNSAEAGFLVETKHFAKVQTGSMYLFPGWLPHSSMKNCSGEDRIIVGFNVCL